MGDSDCITITYRGRTIHVVPDQFTIDIITPEPITVQALDEDTPIIINQPKSKSLISIRGIMTDGVDCIAREKRWVK